MFNGCSAGWRKGSRGLGVGLQLVRGLAQVEPCWLVAAEWFVRAGDPGGSGGSPADALIDPEAADTRWGAPAFRLASIRSGLIGRCRPRSAPTAPPGTRRVRGCPMLLSCTAITRMARPGSTWLRQPRLRREPGSNVCKRCPDLGTSGRVMTGRKAKKLSGFEPCRGATQQPSTPNSPRRERSSSGCVRLPNPTEGHRSGM